VGICRAPARSDWIAIGITGWQRLLNRGYDRRAIPIMKLCLGYIFARLLGANRSARLVSFDIQSVYAQMFERGPSPRTIQYTDAVLQSAFRQPVRWRVVGECPVCRCRSAACEAAWNRSTERRGMPALLGDRDSV
jgi:hypothetical protein